MKEEMKERCDALNLLLASTVAVIWSLIVGFDLLFFTFIFFISYPWKFKGRIYSIFGGFNPDGGVYSIFGIIQAAGQDAKSIFGIASIQIAGRNAEIIFGLAGSQISEKSSLCTIGLLIYQKSKNYVYIGWGRALIQRGLYYGHGIIMG